MNSRTSWTNTYDASNEHWLAESLNYSTVPTNFANDWVIGSFLSQNSFLNQYWAHDALTKVSYIDVLLVKDSTRSVYTSNLLLALFNDVASATTVCFLSLPSLLQSEYQEIFSTILMTAPELSIVLSEFAYTYSLLNAFESLPTAVFDVYSNNLGNGSISILLFDLQFWLYVWFYIFFFTTTLTLRWVLPFSAQFVRLYYYVYSISRETRIQFEAFLQTFVFFLVYWFVTLMAFDDNQEEVIEFMDTSFFYFFTLMVFYLAYKYSIHYFAFLDASISEGRTIGFMAKQVFKDFLNSLSLLLRFYILLFRINVYDTLDDFFDSYYIFLGDFDEDEYLNELFLSIHGTLLFLPENDYDTSFLLEDETDFTKDLFYIYFIVWGKIFYFCFFILEEAARLSLAFYICYLIIFEIHNVNCSYHEDSFALNKKLRF